MNRWEGSTAVADAIVFFVSATKNGVGFFAFIFLLFFDPDRSVSLTTIVLFAQVAAFGAVGVFTFLSAKDVQSRLFGVVLSCIGNAYAFGLIISITRPELPWHHPCLVLLNIKVEFFLAWYLWRFVATFPDAPLPFTAMRVVRFFLFLTWASGWLFIVVGALRIFKYYTRHVFEHPLPPFLEAVSLLSYSQWEIIMPQVLVGMMMLVYKHRHVALPVERRRGQVFIFSLALSLGVPPLLLVIGEFWPMFAGFLKTKPGFLTGNVMLFLAPFATAYAVVAHNVLDVQLIARSALQHLLARTSATVLGLAPFFFLVLFLFQNRGLTLEQLFTGQRAIVLVVTTAVGLIFLRFREPILDGIDRRFFRERYNARVVLTQLAEQVRGTRNVRELSNMVGQGVDLALHLERVTLLAQDPQLGHFIDPQDKLRPLDPGSRLATLVQGQREPLEVDLDSPASPLHGLDERERHWLVDGKIELIAPTYALDGGMIGLLALGGKKSELPFLKEDRDLLQSVCSATGLVLELMTLKEQTMPPTRVTPIPVSPSGSFPVHEIVDPVAEGARECALCQRIYPASEDRCPRDDFELESTLVPYVLRGQYRFEKRLGSGGMAVVYLATDLRLGRSVAIKTLPRVSPEAAMRLHREARTAATVTHPGLASIYGIETWEGVPMLILELLPGGTLADQLIAGEPLDPLLAVDMGKSVALALQKIHRAGILHRDIKPSNIGYTEEGQAKLLDFGVARIQHDLRQESGDLSADEPVDERSRVLNTADWVIGRTATGQLVGTLSYLSPEAVRGGRPEPAFDLWALNVVLWESLTGENLFKGRLMPQVLDNIRDGKTKSIRERLPDCPEPVAEYFDRELALDKGQRAASGRELHERLVELERQLVD